MQAKAALRTHKKKIMKKSIGYLMPRSGPTCANSAVTSIGGILFMAMSTLPYRQPLCSREIFGMFSNYVDEAKLQ